MPIYKLRVSSQITGLFTLLAKNRQQQCFLVDGLYALTLDKYMYRTNCLQNSSVTW